MPDRKRKTYIKSDSEYSDEEIPSITNTSQVDLRELKEKIINTDTLLQFYNKSIQSTNEKNSLIASLRKQLLLSDNNLVEQKKQYQEKYFKLSQIIDDQRNKLISVKRELDNKVAEISRLTNGKRKQDDTVEVSSKKAKIDGSETSSPMTVRIAGSLSRSGSIYEDDFNDDFDNSFLDATFGI